MGAVRAAETTTARFLPRGKTVVSHSLQQEPGADGGMVAGRDVSSSHPLLEGFQMLKLNLEISNVQQGDDHPPILPGEETGCNRSDFVIVTSGEPPCRR